MANELDEERNIIRMIGRVMTEHLDAFADWVRQECVLRVNVIDWACNDRARFKVPLEIHGPWPAAQRHQADTAGAYFAPKAEPTKVPSVESWQPDEAACVPKQWHVDDDGFLVLHHQAGGSTSIGLRHVKCIDWIEPRPIRSV